MEDVGIQVGSVWPDHCPELRIDPNLPEELWILPQRLEDRAPEVGFEINLACAPIVEAKPKGEPSSGSTERIRAVLVLVLMAVAEWYGGGRARPLSPSSPPAQPDGIVAHSLTSRSARGGSSPPKSSSVSITICA